MKKNILIFYQSVTEITEILLLIKRYPSKSCTIIITGQENFLFVLQKLKLEEKYGVKIFQFNCLSLKNPINLIKMYYQLNFSKKAKEIFNKALNIYLSCVAANFYIGLIFLEEKKNLVPGVVHTDGTGRLQTVKKENNLRYYKLIKEFFNITGVPIILNTSFNENEPIVFKPEEALNCFLRTKMDILVMENWVISRN